MDGRCMVCSQEIIRKESLCSIKGMAIRLCSLHADSCSCEAKK